MPDKELYDPSRYNVSPVGERFSEILHEHGSLVYSFDAQSGWMNLCMLSVDKDFRRAGIGTNILKYSKELAADLGAKVMIAAITSREAYDAVVGVFGEEPVTVTSLGDYMQPGTDKPVSGTSAMLWYVP